MKNLKFKKECLDCKQLFKPETKGHTSKYCKKCLKTRVDKRNETIRKNLKLKAYK